jgi:hypothetical protein
MWEDADSIKHVFPASSRLLCKRGWIWHPQHEDKLALRGRNYQAQNLSNIFRFSYLNKRIARETPSLTCIQHGIITVVVITITSYRGLVHCL